MAIKRQCPFLFEYNSYIETWLYPTLFCPLVRHCCFWYHYYGLYMYYCHFDGCRATYLSLKYLATYAIFVQYKYWLYAYCLANHILVLNMLSVIHTDQWIIDTVQKKIACSCHIVIYLMVYCYLLIYGSTLCAWTCIYKYVYIYIYTDLYDFITEHN